MVIITDISNTIILFVMGVGGPGSLNPTN